MANRIDLKFRQLKKEGKKALIVYIMSGLPNIALTQKLILALENSGADLIELGIPFSDPVADGPIIQKACARALEHGVTLEENFELVKRVRSKTKIPLVFMLYYNLILNLGEKRFVEQAKAAGVDGIIVPDLPVEEAGRLIKFARRSDLATIFFITPTSNPERIRRNISSSAGFIYYISRTGVTGAKTLMTPNLAKGIRKIKKISKRPVCVGFGINNREQVKMINKFADGVIVGSAVVKIILENNREKEIINRVSKFVRSLNV